MMDRISLKAVLESAATVCYRFCTSCGQHFGTGPALYVPIGEDHVRVCKSCRSKWKPKDKT